MFRSLKKKAAAASRKKAPPPRAPTLMAKQATTSSTALLTSTTSTTPAAAAAAAADSSTANTNQHCEHCTGKFGRCACPFGCSPIPNQKTQCSAISKHCHHCYGGVGDCCCTELNCKARPESQCTAVHTGIQCASCSSCNSPSQQQQQTTHQSSQAILLRGPRFKCMTCDSEGDVVNFCMQCYYDGRADHPRSHQFIKMERPGSEPVLVPFRGGDTQSVLEDASQQQQQQQQQQDEETNNNNNNNNVIIRQNNLTSSTNAIHPEDAQYQQQLFVLDCTSRTSQTTHTSHSEEQGADEKAEVAEMAVAATLAAAAAASATAANTTSAGSAASSAAAQQQQPQQQDDTSSFKNRREHRIEQLISNDDIQATPPSSPVNQQSHDVSSPPSQPSTIYRQPSAGATHPPAMVRITTPHAQLVSTHYTANNTSSRSLPSAFANEQNHHHVRSLSQLSSQSGLVAAAPAPAAAAAAAAASAASVAEASAHVVSSSSSTPAAAAAVQVAEASNNQHVAAPIAMVEVMAQHVTPLPLNANTEEVHHHHHQQQQQQHQMLGSVSSDIGGSSSVCSFRSGQVLRLQGLTKASMNGKLGTVQAITAAEKVVLRINGQTNPVVVSARYLVEAFPVDMVVLLPNGKPGVVVSSGNGKVMVIESECAKACEYDPEHLIPLEELE